MKRFMLVLAACAFVTACGGGSRVMTPTPPMQPMQPTTPEPVGPAEAFDGAVPRTSGIPAFTFPGLGTLNTSAPQFGSVAMNIYTPGLANVRDVATTFNGDRFTVNVTRQNGTSFNVDTDRDLILLGYDYTPAENPITDRPASEGILVAESGGTYTAGAAFIEWNATDYTDYMAAGYWVHADTNTNALEMGAFIDGPAFDMAAQIPSLGTATYTGRTGGVYVARGGSDAIVNGAFEEGQYESDLSLTANFANMTIGGNADNVVIFDTSVYHPDGTHLFDSAAEATTYRVDYAPAPIMSNGTFTGNNITVTSQDYDVDTTSGTWAGQFSGVNDGDGNPRAVAGTNAVYFDTTGGSEAIFTGAFYGATEQFE